MAEEEGGGGINLKRKVGPFPMYMWFIGAGAVGLVLYRMMGGKSAATAGGGKGQGTSFQSSNNTSGTDAQGNQYSTSYSAQGDGYLPGMLTYGAGPMPFQQGDVYVNYPVQSNPGTTPPPAPTTAPSRTVLNPAFNEVGWSDQAKQSPWTMTVARPGESWKDITARIYGFADNYAKITDPTAKARVDSVSDYIRKTNAAYTGTIPDGSGPTPGSVVVYR